MAGNWLAANYPDGEIDAAAENFSVFWIYGWVGYKGEIESFGYKLGEEITYGDFAWETGEDVKNAGGANAQRFHIAVPVVFRFQGTPPRGETHQRLRLRAPARAFRQRQPERHDPRRRDPLGAR